VERGTLRPSHSVGGKKGREGAASCQIEERGPVHISSSVIPLTFSQIREKKKEKRLPFPRIV